MLILHIHKGYFHGHDIVYQDQGFGRGCLFRWYSTNLQTYSIQGIKRCARILRWTRKAWNKWHWSYPMGWSYLESLLFAISWWKNHKGENRSGSVLEKWCYCYWSNIWIAWKGCMWHLVKCVAKNIHGVSDMQEACLFWEWKEYV